MPKMFLLYDGRAKSGETEDATVMDTAHSEEEARQSGEKNWAGHDAIWYECDVDDAGAGNPINEKPRWDIPPCVMPKQTRVRKRKRGRNANTTT